jgi:GNAT superfamily N-acetyltransferase
MFQIERTDSANDDFKALVKLLDEELTVRDGADHPFYDQFNKLDRIKYVVVAYLEEEPVGCGAIKAFDAGIMEIKRMYVKPTLRGRGIAVALLQELEKWSSELGVKACILETGVNQPEAISLYKKCKYQIRENFGPYAGVEKSICFQKNLV